MAKEARKKADTVKVDGVVSNGKGGYFKKGDELPEGCDIESLKAKGYA